MFVSGIVLPLRGYSFIWQKPHWPVLFLREGQGQRNTCHPPWWAVSWIVKQQVACVWAGDTPWSCNQWRDRLFSHIPGWVKTAIYVQVITADKPSCIGDNICGCFDIRNNDFHLMLSNLQAHLPVWCGGDRVQTSRRQLRDERSDRPAPLQDHQQPHVWQGEPKGLHMRAYSFHWDPALLSLF